MNDQQIVTALLSFYKQQGVDLHHVLDDPTFVKLPIASKILAIKTHAKIILDGTSPGFTSRDRDALISRALRMSIQGALAGGSIGAALGAGRLVPSALGALSGLGAGLGVSALGAYSSVAGKEAVRQQLHNTAYSPTDSNAVGTLSMGHFNKGTNAYVTELLQAVSDASNAVISEKSMASRIKNYQAATASQHL